MRDKKLNTGSYSYQSEQIRNLLNEARRLNSEDNPTEAIATLNKIIQLNPNEINNPAVLRSFALCNQTKRNYKEAIKYFEKLTQGADCKPSDLILFVNCYEAIKSKEAYEKAIMILKQPLFNDDFKAQHHLGLCYQNLGNLDLAFPIYKRMTQKWPTEFKGFLALAHWYENNKQYKAAVDIYNTITDPKAFVEKQLALGFCYGKWNKPKDAIKIFDTLKNNPTALLAKARCYQTLNDYKTAQKIYLSIPNWEKNPTTAISYGRCCQEMKEFPEAFKVFKTLTNRTDLSLKDKLDVALGLSYCYEEKARIENTHKGKQLCHESAIKVLENALKIFQNNSGREAFETKLRQVKLSLARAYQGKKDFVTARELFDELLADKYDDYPDILLGLGYFYKAQEQYPEAIKTFNAFFELRPYSKERIALGQCYLAKKNFENASELFKEILNNDGTNLQALLGLAEYCYKAKADYSGAYQIYERLIKEPSNNKAITEIRFAYSNCFDSEGKIDKAIEVLQKIDVWPQNTFVLIKLASLYQKKGDFDKAIQMYDCILQIDPTHANTLLGLGLCFQEIGEHEKAIEIFNKLRTLSNTNPAMDEKAQLAVAYCYAKKGEHQEAISRFKALSNNPEAEIGQAYCYEAQCKYDEAITILEKYRKVKYLDLAICYEKKGDSDSAIKIYMGIAPEEHTFVSKLSLARCHLARKEYDLAINLLNTLLKEKDKTLVIQAQYALADSYRKTGKNKEAFEIYSMIPPNFEQKMVLAHFHEECGNPKDAIALYLQVNQTNLTVKQLKQLNLNLARCYANNDFHKEAIEKYKAFLKHEPNSREQLLALAFCYQEARLFDESIKTFKEILNINNGDWQAALGLARVYQIKGENTSVLHLYEKMIEENKDNPTAIEEILLGLARYYQETATKHNENYTKAIDTFKRVSDWEKKVKVRLGLARLYQQMGAYTEALSEYEEMMRHAPEDAEALLSFGRCYQEMGKFDPKYYQQALLQLKKLPAGHKQREVSIACCMREMGQTDEANKQFQVFQNSPEGQLLFATHLERIGEYDKAIDILKASSEPHAIILLANCYKKIGHFELAINTYNLSSPLSVRTQFQIVKYYMALQDFSGALAIINDLLQAENPSTVIDAQFALAIFHEHMGNYEEALRTYMGIPFSFNRELSRAFCYREMGNYEQAKLLYHQLESFASSPKQLRNLKLALAICHEKMGGYEHAIATYKETLRLTPWNDLSILKNIARCYAEMGEEKLMLKTFEGMLEWKETQGSLGRCYQTLGYYRKAIDILLKAESKYPPFEKLSLACCYQALNKPIEAWHTYQELTEQFPYFVDAQYFHCQYAIDQEKPDVEFLLTKFQNSFPNDPRCYLLDFQLKNKRHAQTTENSLLEGINRFPYFTEFYLSLIHHKAEKGQLKEATRLQQECQKRFPGHPKFQSFKDTSLISNKTTTSLPRVEKQIRINLPPIVKDVFASLKRVSGKPYLVGSFIHKLLGAKVLGSQDIDMLVMLKENQTFQTKGYYHCPYNAKLYQRRFNEGDKVISVDCFVRQETDLKTDALDRDFTINCLYCDENGCVYDPTGFGETDLKNRLLRTVIDTQEYAEQSFKDDPVRLLRVCRYRACNYKVTEHIEKAMRAWTTTDKLDRLHLKAVTLSHLNKLPMEEGIVYVSLLRSYRLIEPLFGIKDEDSPLKELIQALRKCCTANLSPVKTLSPKNNSHSPRIGTSVTSQEKNQQNQITLLKRSAAATKPLASTSNASTDTIINKPSSEIRPNNAPLKDNSHQGKGSGNNSPRLFKPSRPQPSIHPQELDYKK